MWFRLTASVILAVALSAPAVVAQPVPGPQRMMKGKGKGKQGLGPGAIRQLERIRLLTPEQRRRFLQNLPPARRQALQRMLQQYEALPPPERRRLNRLYNQFEELPAARRQRIRGLYNTLPAPRRGVLRQELQTLRSMKPEDREARMDSREFQERYSEQEQELLNEMLGAMEEMPQSGAPPAQPPPPGQR